MFLTGHISDDLEPFLKRLAVRGKRKEKISIEAILDTGFNGELALPEGGSSAYDLDPLGIKTFELANGQIVEQNIFIATLLIQGKAYPVEATLTRSKVALVGMELIRNKVAVFNLKTNRISVRD